MNRKTTRPYVAAHFNHFTYRAWAYYPNWSFSQTCDLLIPEWQWLTPDNEGHRILLTSEACAPGPIEPPPATRVY